MIVSHANLIDATVLSVLSCLIYFGGLELSCHSVETRPKYILSEVGESTCWRFNALSLKGLPCRGQVVIRPPPGASVYPNARTSGESFGRQFPLSACCNISVGRGPAGR